MLSSFGVTEQNCVYTENVAMTTDLPLTPSHQPNAGHSAVVKINGEMVDVRDWAPTARQILAAAGLQPVTEYVLLSWPEHGPTEELGLDETISLPRNGSVAEFLAMQADAVFYFMLNDLRFAWAGLLTTEDVRKVGRVPNTMECGWSTVTSLTWSWKKELLLTFWPLELSACTAAGANGSWMCMGCSSSRLSQR